MKRRRLILWLVVGVLVALLAACGEDDPGPDTDPPILGGVESLPKEIATVVLTPTATAVIGGPGGLPDPLIPTAGPPLPTPTMTPYVGIFLGQPTSESGEAVSTIPPLAPYTVDTGAGNVISSSAGGCGVPVAQIFVNAYAAAQDRLGCPVGGAVVSTIVTQPFERGDLYWRDVRQIYALADSGQFWQIADNWQEGMEDPSLGPPAGLIQPVRGFGLAWRSNPAVQEALGWGTQPESPYSGQWQDFERGAMLTGADELIYAIFPGEGRHSGPLSP